MKQFPTKPLLIALLPLSAAGVLLALSPIGHSRPTAWPTPSPTATPSAIVTQAALPSPATKTAAEPGGGTIEGPVTYPAETVPTDLRVCAVAIPAAAPVCVGQISDARFPGGIGYRLNLPAGSYHVYAVADSFDPAYRAYYSRFVQCGKSYGCADHTPVTIKVTAGSVSSGIEPGDFYR